MLPVEVDLYGFLAPVLLLSLAYRPGATAPVLLERIVSPAFSPAGEMM